MSDETPTPVSDDAVRHPSPMARVGEELSRARASRGLSVDDVAAQLKFAPRQVLALEKGEPEGVPGGAFARGMIRSYCRLLRIDPEPLLDLMPVALPDADRLTERFSQPVPFSDSARRWNVAYASVAVAALAVAGWFAYESQSPDAPATVAATTAPAAERSPQPTMDAVAARADAAQPVESSTPSAPSAPAAGAESPSAPSTAITAKPSTELNAQAQVGNKPAPGMRRLVLRFQREAWVEVRDNAGRTVFSQLNPAGSERVVDSPVPVSLVIGNAQHVRLSMDGSPVDLQPYIKVEVARLTLP